jgi:hypothetical protein
MEQSGFAWTEKDGAAVMAESESVWEAYVKVSNILFLPRAAKQVL